MKGEKKMYKKLKLVGYDRLGVTGITSIDIDFTEDVLLVLGDNGSGKSSLLSEVTMWPSEKEYFDEGGYKYIEKHVDGVVWVSEMCVGKKTTYQLYRDGVALNDTSSITRQKELVTQHFGVDQSIKDLLTGYEKFSKMSPMRKKDWFLKMKTMDYEWVIKLHKKAIDDYRDVCGAIRIINKQLTTETAKLVDSVTSDKSIEEVGLLSDVIDELMLGWRAADRVDNGSAIIDSINSQIDSYIKSMRDIVFDPISLTDIDEQLSSLNVAMHLNKFTLEQSYLKIEEWQKKIAQFDSLHVGNLGEIDKNISEINDDIKKLMSMDYVVADNPVEVHDVWVAMKAQVMQVLYDVPRLEASYYSTDKLKSQSDKLVIARRAKEIARDNIIEINTQIKHISNHKDHKDVVCPECSHEFSSIYDELKLNDLNSQLSEKEKQFDLIAKDISELESDICDRQRALEALRAFNKLKSSLPILGEFWRLISDEKVITGQGLISSICDKFDLMCGNAIALKDKQKKLSDLINLRNVATFDSMNSLAQMRLDLASEESKCNKIHGVIEENKRKADKLNLHKSNYEKLLQYRLNLVKLYRQYKKLIKQREVSAKQVVYNECVTNIITMRNDISEKIKVNDSQLTIVNKLKQDLLDLEDKKLSLEELCKHLSPNEGVVAKSISSFISQFIQEVNDCISSIWSYDLEVLECLKQVDNFELDYKFGFTAADSKPRNDVAKGSTAIIDIIDFAFKFVTQIYLGLHTEPLFLDEFAAHFSPKHRISAGAFIRKCIEDNTFSQVLMISHYKEMYDGFSNVQVCALSGSDVDIPDQFVSINESITIQR